MGERGAERGSWQVVSTDQLSTTIAMAGEFDGDECEDLRDALAACSATSRETRLDMTGVTFFGSRALGAVLAAHDVARRRGASLLVVGAGRPVHRLLELTGTDYLLGTAGQSDDATAEDSPPG